MTEIRKDLIDRLVAAACLADAEATDTTKDGQENFWNVDKYESILRKRIIEALEVQP